MGFLQICCKYSHDTNGKCTSYHFCWQEGYKRMGLRSVIFKTFEDFGSHTTIGGLCNAGLAESRPRQGFKSQGHFVLKS
jgi:hypothetical protein